MAGLAQVAQNHLSGERLAAAKEEVLAIRRLGWSSQHCADVIGIGRRTLTEWTEVDPEFCEAWADAYEGGSDWGEDKLRDKVEAGNTDANLAFLRLRRRLVPDSAVPPIQIQVVWAGQVFPEPGRVIEGQVRELLSEPESDSQPQQPQSASLDSSDSPEPTP